MEILHLCSYYIGNKLYKKFISEISSHGAFQTIYIPIKNKELVNRNIITSPSLDYYYDLVLKKHDRVLYKGKITKQKKRVEKQVQGLMSKNIIHAHTLFSDGGTAYLLKLKYGINYVVSVRNTDINTFYKYAIHYRSFSHEILKNADAIIFISPAYKAKAFNILPNEIVEIIKEKTHILPNGIDNAWLTTEIPKKKIDLSKKLNLLFIGSLNKNKNLQTVLKLMAKLFNDGRDVYLNVAGDGPLKDKFKLLATRMGIIDRVEFHGNIPKEELIVLVDQSDIFILPSYKETFGISYIESMSRGVPVIYTRNQGIDGYFPEGCVGFSTDPDSIVEMNTNIDKIIDDYEYISRKCKETAKNFNWKEITNDYFSIINKISIIKF